MEELTKTGAVEMVGRTISHYRVLRRIGSGGMGVVYEAEDLKLGRHVALKFLPENFAGNESSRRRFEQEARAASLLNHPNICTIHDIEECDGRFFIAMELLQGESLDARLKHGPLPLDEALHFCTQICDALESAHAARIIHRDLKPANLFITLQSHVKVLDFGLAKIIPAAEAGTASTVEGLTGSGSVVGTVAYMSPEQASGKELDRRSDLFSLGATLYEMVTGQRAYQGATVALLYDSILNHTPAPPSTINAKLPPEADYIVGKALESDRDLRYQSAGELRSDLKRLQRPSSAVPARPGLRIGNPYLKPFLGVLTALVVTIGALLLLLNRRLHTSEPATAHYVQLTDFNDSAAAPAISPDGRMLAFIRPGVFGTSAIRDGQIYVKQLPDGEPVQLTYDQSQKHTPTFSPDGSRIIYTFIDNAFTWDSWQVPVLGGTPHLFMPNASGLTWINDHELLFSKMGEGVHMDLVTAREDRSGERDVYLPPEDADMAHRSALSPDGKWVLIVEMDGAGWLPCRLLPFDGSSTGQRVGPQDGQCTTANWSKDGNWMFFSSKAGGFFHLWRQRFPDGKPEQITSGPTPTEEEGTTLTPDGRFLIASIGISLGSVWMHEKGEDRQLISQGFPMLPSLSLDQRKIYYLLKAGTSRSYISAELWEYDLGSGQRERTLSGFLLSSYALSPDGQRVLFTTAEGESNSGIWIADLERRTPPRRLTSGHENRAFFGAKGEIIFLTDSGTRYLYRMKEDGSEQTKAFEDAVTHLIGVSPGGEWAAVSVPKSGGRAGNAIKMVPLRGGQPILICEDACRLGFGPGRNQAPFVSWSRDGKQLYVSLQYLRIQSQKTAAIPFKSKETLLRLAKDPKSEKDFQAIPGTRLLPERNVFAGLPLPDYLFWRATAQSNLYKIPVPE